VYTLDTQACGRRCDCLRMRARQRAGPTYHSTMRTNTLLSIICIIQENFVTEKIRNVHYGHQVPTSRRKPLPPHTSYHHHLLPQWMNFTTKTVTDDEATAGLNDALANVGPVAVRPHTHTHTHIHSHIHTHTHIHARAQLPT
jgi:hypothetical protein